MKTDKYIDSDYENGMAFLRVAVINTLNAVDNNIIKEKNFHNLSLSFLTDCIKSIGWTITGEQNSPSDYYLIVEGNNSVILCGYIKKSNDIFIKNNGTY